MKNLASGRGCGLQKIRNKRRLLLISIVLASLLASVVGLSVVFFLPSSVPVKASASEAGNHTSTSVATNQTASANEWLITSAPAVPPTAVPSNRPTRSPLQSTDVADQSAVSEATYVPTWFSQSVVQPSLPPTPRKTNNPTSPLPTSPPPTRRPTLRPTQNPTNRPTNTATTPPTLTPLPQQATFYVVGDIPYTRPQAAILSQQMADLPQDAEFLVHVGDLRYAEPHLRCRSSEFEDVAARLNISHAPVFVILGDNDWTDCPNQDEGLQLWKDSFLGFESKYWNHTFQIMRQPGREENFAFQHKGTLFVGLNIVGGDRNNHNEWSTRLSEQYAWTKGLINVYNNTLAGSTGRVVVFGHANPNFRHREFFLPLQSYIANELFNRIPILYVNGDKHEYSYDPVFYSQESLLRVMVSGKGIDPPLQVVVTADGTYQDPQRAFAIDRYPPQL